MLYNDTITVVHELVGQGSAVVVSGTSQKTVVGVSIVQSNVASQSWVKCGTTTFALNYAKDLPHVEMNYGCANTISVEKTGQDSAFFIINYVPRNLNNETNTSVLISGDIDISTQSAYYEYTKIWHDNGLFIITLGIAVLGMTLGAILGRLMFPKSL